MSLSYHKTYSKSRAKICSPEEWMIRVYAQRCREYLPRPRDLKLPPPSAS